MVALISPQRDIDRRVLSAIAARDFNGTGAHPSQQTIADELAVSREYVNRSVKRLAHMGLVDIEKRQRPGNRRGCFNHYSLMVWNPVRRVRDRAKCARSIPTSQVGVHTKGTAKPMRDESSAQGPSNANAGGETQYVRSTNSSVAESEVRDRANKIECEQCVEHEKRIETLRKVVDDAEFSNREMAEQLKGTQAQLVRAGRVEIALRGELAKEREEQPEADDIRELMHLWRDECKAGNKRHVLRVSDPRGQRTAWALKRYGKKRCHDAIMGVTLDDWAMGRDRRTSGKQFNDLSKHVFKDNETFERFELAWIQRHDRHTKPPVAIARHQRSWPHPFPRIIEALEHVKEVGNGQWSARCPGHEDRHASLSVAEGDKGAVIHCHTGCDQERIASGLGIPVSEWFYPTQEDATPVKRTLPPTPDPLPSLITLNQWQARLLRNDRVLDKLNATRGWAREAIKHLGIGWDGQRFALPVYDSDGQLQTIARYLPTATPKMLGLRGRDRGLFPAPESVEGKDLWIVEGEPDAVAAQSVGLPAVAIPGVAAWHHEWEERIGQRRVVVCLDCDEKGREAALRVGNLLARVAWEVRVFDISPHRADGYDLTDYLLGDGTVDELRARAKESSPIFQQRPQIVRPEAA